MGSDLGSSPNRLHSNGHVTGYSPIIRADARRVTWLAGVAVSACLLGTARALTPDPRGFGTHTQLGLPACLFRHWTGVPCPACGLTTSFAHMARGAFAAAWRSQPVGPMAFMCVICTLPLCVYAAVRGSARFDTCARTGLRRVGVAVAAAWLGEWLVRVGCLLLG
jgi:hypothetical protein